MSGVTLFDHDMNFVLIGVELGETRGGLIQTRVSNRKGVLSEVDMRSYKTKGAWWSRKASPPQLLDDLVIYATSPQDYFEIMTTCASLRNQPKYVNGVPSPEPGKSLFIGKRAFFASLREQRGFSDCRSHRLTIAGGVDFTLADLCLAFNPGSLALLSFPAYLVMDWKSGFFQVPQQPVQIGRWLYDLRAGDRGLKNFDDYSRTFLSGIFRGNNSDVFLTTYGLAHAVVAFVEDIKNYDSFESATSFRDYITYEPLLYVLERLIEIGALHDPFNGAAVWKTCDAGIENAQEVNPRLAATLRLTDTLAPITTTPAMPAAILQAFYGLVDILPLREYFSIDRRVKFEYPVPGNARQTPSMEPMVTLDDEIPF